MHEGPGETTLDAVDRLHRDVDGRAARLAEKNAARMHCGLGCTDCCVDDLTVFEVEAEVIRTRHAELLRSGTPRAEGACAFLDDDGGCRIYADRPYVCRTQGLPLRWFTEDDRLQPVELRDICPLNDQDGEWPPLEGMPANAFWTIGPYESQLRRLQASRGDHGDGRVRLRDLFHR